MRLPPFVLVDPWLRPVVAAGIARAGPGGSVATADDEDEVAAILQDGVEARCVIVTAAPSDVLIDQVTSLVERGARPIPTIAVRTGAGVTSAGLDLLCSLPSGLNVAVPSLAEDEERRRLWSSLRRAEIERRHHLVEVDPRPALDELATTTGPMDGDAVQLMAAGASGVLAGRMAATDLRWARSLEG